MRPIQTRGFYRAAVCLLILAVAPSLVRAQHFWGMTSNGGAYSGGSLFSMNADGSGANVVYSFQTGSTGGGYNPEGSPIVVGGLLYGVTYSGGVNSGGVIFSYDTAAGVYTDLYDFAAATGRLPKEGLTVGADGKLYGVTYAGGAHNSGVIYSFDPSTSTYQDLYDLAGATGSRPYGPLTLYNNVFYGLTYLGGANNSGVFFSFDPAADTYTDLYDLTGGLSGDQSTGRMVIYNGTLYGVNNNSGAFSAGEIFSYSAGVGYTSLYSFGSSGSQFGPFGLILYNNVLYGVANGGVNGTGGIFSFDPGTATYNEPMSFPSYSGGPSQGTIFESNGAAWGIGYSAIYRVDLSTYAYAEPAQVSTFSANGLSYFNALTMYIAPPVTGTTPQTITFGNDTVTYGAADLDPGATASSGKQVYYRSGNSAVATIKSGKIHIVGAGTCYIIASQPGDSVYAPIADTASLTVVPAPLVIGVADTVKNQLQPNPVFRITYSGFVYSDSASSLLTLPAAVTTATQSSPQGTYPVTVSGGTSDNYVISYTAGVLTVIGQLQLLSYVDTVVVYGRPDTAAGASSTGLPVTYTSSNPNVATITSDQQVHIRSVGTTLITVSQAGTSTYAANSATFAVQVTPAPLTIAADNKTKVFDGPDPVFTATYAGFVNGDDTNSLTAKPVFAPTNDAGSPPGTYLINVGGAADSNYTIGYTSGTFLLTPVGGAGANSFDAYFSSPSSLKVNVWMTAAQTALIRVYDAGGRRLFSEQVALGQGYNMFTMPAAGLVSGVYIIQIAGDNLKLTLNIRKID